MRYIAAILLLFVTSLSLAAPLEVRGARIKELPYGTQLLLDTNAPVDYTSFLLDNPPRLVVDIGKTRLTTDLGHLSMRSVDVNGVRTGVREGLDLRLVVDLPVLVHHEIYLIKTAEVGHRLIVDLYRNQRPDPTTIRANVLDTTTTTQQSLQRPEPVSSRGRDAEGSAVMQPVERSQAKPVRRELVIAIDPGHGGKDSGAIGPRYTQEKEVVMQIARRLQRLVNREPGMRAVLTRNGDTYLHLYERIDIARKHKADLFISLHADACEDCDARGSSVFILSTKGASSAAAHWLAKKENEADLIGSGKLANVNEELVPVVFDMVHDAVLADSMRLAEKMLASLNEVGDVHTGRIERAGFAVLKAPDIPSILMETAFISNPDEERKLVNSRHQERVAQAIMEGIRAYFGQRPQELIVAEALPAKPPTVARKPGADPSAVKAMAAQKTTTVVALASKPMKVATTSSTPRPEKRLPPQLHVIQRGESLADIAERYRISLSSLRSANGLDNNQLRMPAGTPLTIPTHDS
jgi:N-acetylmuramoyl-L-alanine amidase